LSEERDQAKIIVADEDEEEKVGIE